ncbi:MAG: TipC family immunity protein [Lachnospiraceae bacterium]|nr:TipC family immunity protein [Lachnospiraceae bacterium]
MVDKKELWISVRIIVILLIVLAAGAGIWKYESRSDPDTGFDKVTNVFDEMIEEKYTVVEEAEHVTAGGYDAVRLYWQVKEGTPLRIGIVYIMEYKKLYIYGDACMPEEIRDMSYQEYFEKSLAEYGITWEEVEDRKEDFICKNILEQWFTGHKSSFSKDRLGELEVLDFLMPYEYCGKDNSEWMTVTETVEEGYKGSFQGKIQYTEWDAGNLLCKQTQKSRDYGYHDIMERIEADMNGFNTVSEEIIVEWYSKRNGEDGDKQEYIPLTSIFGGKNVSEFPEWLKTSGKVEGNLTKLSYTREEGEAKTREIIEKYTELRIWDFFKTADYYIAGDELNIRLAYYDYEADDPGWLENGKGEIWQGWITLKIDDIREFLSGDGFYIEEK